MKKQKSIIMKSVNTENKNLWKIIMLEAVNNRHM